MKNKECLLKQLTYLFRTAIAREQKQFIKIAFAVHFSAVISAERYRSESKAMKSAIPILVYFYVLCNNKSYKKGSGFLMARKGRVFYMIDSDIYFSSDVKYIDLGTLLYPVGIIAHELTHAYDTVVKLFLYDQKMLLKEEWKCGE
ncbi:hypothetical protein [Treponema sp. OMZ 787]|uniref:hypothetical protein n=1 Tax=Treponema sp. OMZ 787 TaxID=2563669 RepID=UPI0020A40122|nr:hypothetical protein [Treponema sp. OMZ 787]